MKILYLTEDYFYSKVHHSLVSSLIKERDDVSCTLFTLYREPEGVKNIESQYGKANYELISVKNQSNQYRYKLDFRYKINYKLKALMDKVDINKYDLIFASTIFSEGALAYKLSMKHNIPYVVAVRGTDSSLYFKYMFHLWLKAKKILSRAKQVFFISPNLLYKTYNHVCLRSSEELFKSKSLVIPNGIDRFWLNNYRSIKARNNNAIKQSFEFLFIGRLDKNKNIKNTIKAFLQTQKKYLDYNLSFTIVGENGYYSDYVKSITRKNSNINYLGPIYDKMQLLKCMRIHNVFIMVSHSETFGLVYIEALSQSLPIIFTKNQGIDGCFTNNKIGERVNSKSVKSIARGMSRIIENYEFYDFVESDLSSFSWENIALRYLKNI